MSVLQPDGLPDAPKVGSIYEAEFSTYSAQVNQPFQTPQNDNCPPSTTSVVPVT